MSLVPEASARQEEANEVIEYYVQNVKPQEIARLMGITTRDVNNHLMEWRESVRGSEVAKEHIEERLSMMDEHYSTLIRKAYEIVEDTEMSEDSMKPQMLSQRKGALELIAKLERDRLDMLHKSGLLDAVDVGEELVRMEQQKEAILKILSEELCDSCKRTVMTRLADALQSTVVVVEDNV